VAVCGGKSRPARRSSLATRNEPHAQPHRVRGRRRPRAVAQHDLPRECLPSLAGRRPRASVPAASARIHGVKILRRVSHWAPKRCLSPLIARPWSRTLPTALLVCLPRAGSRVGDTLSASHALPIFRRIRHARCFREVMQATTCPPSIGPLNEHAARQCYHEGQGGGWLVAQDVDH
jgi:hypothetical protein